MTSTATVDRTADKPGPDEDLSGASSTQVAPLIIDLGKQKRKAVKQLRKGAGRLMQEVIAEIEELRTAGTISPSAQPIIVVVTQKRRRPGWLMPGL